MPTTDDARQHRRASGGGGKEVPASFLSSRTIPHVLLTLTMLPSRFLGSPAVHVAGTRRAPVAQRGGGGWSNPSHHFLHRRCGWVHGNVVNILRSSPAFLASPRAHSSPLKSDHRTARCATPPSSDWSATWTAIARSLGRCSERSRPLF